MPNEQNTTAEKQKKITFSSTFFQRYSNISHFVEFWAAKKLLKWVFGGGCGLSALVRGCRKAGPAALRGLLKSPPQHAGQAPATWRASRFNPYRYATSFPLINNPFNSFSAFQRHQRIQACRQTLPGNFRIAAFQCIKLPTCSPHGI